MGHQLSTACTGLGRFFEYPVKRKPICFYRQEDFTATGEPQKRATDIPTTAMTDYDNLVDLFYKRLSEQRQYNQLAQEMKEQDRRWSMQKVVLRFPGWNEVTIANLHSLFLLFDNQSIGMLCGEMKEQDRRWSMQKVVQRFPGWNEVTIANLHSLFLLYNQSNGMLGYEDFCAVLESLGDESPMETRKEKFTEADTDNDGWITYDEFLSLVYNFSPMDEDGSISGLARMCNEVADDIQFVSNLTVGEQLEYGLF